MEKIVVEVNSSEIRLDHLLKYSGLAMSGGQAGQFIADGMIKLNGNLISEKRKKIFVNDQVIFNDEYLLEIKEK